MTQPLPLNPTPEDEAQFLTANGFDDADQAALHLLWDHDQFESLLNWEPTALRHHGYRPAAVFDAPFHELDDVRTGFYNQHGFTTHEGHLIEKDERSRNNLAEHTPSEMEELFECDLPHELLFQILFVAKDFSEMDDYRTRYDAADAGTPMTTTHGIDTVESIEAEVAFLYALTQPKVSPAAAADRPPDTPTGETPSPTDRDCRHDCLR